MKWKSQISEYRAEKGVVQGTLTDSVSSVSDLTDEWKHILDYTGGEKWPLLLDVSRIRFFDVELIYLFESELCKNFRAAALISRSELSVILRSTLEFASIPIKVFQSFDAAADWIRVHQSPPQPPAEPGNL